MQDRSSAGNTLTQPGGGCGGEASPEPARLRIVHIVTEVPYPPDKGGKVSFYNHIRDMAANPAIDLRLVLLDADGDRMQHEEHFRGLGIDTRAFRRALPLVGKSVTGGLTAFLSFLFSMKPRVCRLRRNKRALNHVMSLLRKERADAVVFEHISGWELVPKKAFWRVPIIYVCHNVEQKVSLDQFRFQRRMSPLKFFFLGEYLKTRKYEARMMRKLSAVVSISSVDREWYASRYPDKLVLVTDEEVPERDIRWTGSPGGGKLLFVGSPRYFPNLDAIRWLTLELLPRIRRLDSSVTLSVCGMTGEEARLFRTGTDGVDYLGFLEEGELAAMHCSHDLYVCPIIMGSGIKMKILDAISYGMPVTAVRESLAGIRIEGPQAGLDVGDPEGGAVHVLGLLRDREALEGMSRRTLDSVKSYMDNRMHFSRAVMKALRLPVA